MIVKSYLQTEKPFIYFIIICVRIQK